MFGCGENMEQANSSSKTGTLIGENTKMEGLMEWVAMNGKMMEHFMKEISKMGFAMAKENGQRARQSIMAVTVKV